MAKNPSANTSTFQVLGGPDITMGEQSMGYFIQLNYDPSVRATYGTKGTIATIAPIGGGAVKFLQKQDEGVTTNWINPGTGVVPIVDDPFLIYISPTGSDATGDGSFLNPYLSLTKALADVVIPTSTYTIFALPGNYEAANEAVVPVEWKTNANLEGMVANNTAIEFDINYTAGAGDAAVWQFDSIAHDGELMLDLALAGFTSISLINGAFRINRVDANPSGFVNVSGGIFASTFDGLVNCTGALLGPVTVKPGSEVFGRDIFSFGGTFELEGDCVLRTVSGNPSGPYVNGTIVLGNTPTWETDFASYVAPTGAVNVVELQFPSGGSFNPYTATQQVYVDKSGNDGTGTGSIEEPFLTISHALNVIVDATSAKLYEIIVGPGVYAESPTLKPFIFIKGEDPSSTILDFQTIPVALDASFGAAANAVYGFSFMTLKNTVPGPIVLNFNALGGAGTSFMQCFNLIITAAIIPLGRPATADSFTFSGCIVASGIFADSTVLSINNSYLTGAGMNDNFGNGVVRIYNCASGDVITINQTANTVQADYRGSSAPGLTIGGAVNLTYDILPLVNTISSTAVLTQYSTNTVLETGAANLSLTGRGASSNGYVPTTGNMIVSGSAARVSGYAGPDSILVSSGVGSHVQGYSDGATSQIRATSDGAFSSGYSAGNSLVDAIANGAHSFGVALAGANITASGIGSMVRGRVSGGLGGMGASGVGSYVSGYVNATGASAINATNTGAHAMGAITAQGAITASGSGSIAYGNVASGTLSATQSGSQAFGSLVVGLITSTGSGALARGFTTGTGTPTIQAGGLGSNASGYAATDGQITTSGQGTHAHGYVTAASSLITASSMGSTSFGYAVAAGTITSSQTGAFASGSVSGGSITASGNGSRAHGSSQSSGVLQAITLAAYSYGLAFGGTISSSGLASSAIGYASASGSISAVGDGSESSGRALTSGVITSTGAGSYSRGYADGVSSLITATGSGASSLGYVASAGSILTTGLGALSVGSVTVGILNAFGPGAQAFGCVDTGLIKATSQGTMARGYTSGSGTPTIEAAGLGSQASGRVNDGASITTVGDGSFAGGFANGVSSLISAQAQGAFVHGLVSGAGTIRVTNNGAFASGYAIVGAILASGLGSFARGYANATNSKITASGTGATAMGHANGGLEIVASAIGSFAGGDTDVEPTDQIQSTGRGGFTWGSALNNAATCSQAFGIGHGSVSYAAMILGYFADFSSNPFVNPTAADPKDFAVVYGNGVDAGTPSNAWELYKDGRVRSTGSKLNKIRVDSSGAITVDARTDYAIVDDSGLSGTIQLPPGEQGLTFKIKAIGGPATILPDGVETIDGSPSLGLVASEATELIYDVATTTWYIF